MEASSLHQTEGRFCLSTTASSNGGIPPKKGKGTFHSRFLLAFFLLSDMAAGSPLQKAPQTPASLGNIRAGFTHLSVQSLSFSRYKGGVFFCTCLLWKCSESFSYPPFISTPPLEEERTSSECSLL